MEKIFLIIASFSIVNYAQWELVTPTLTTYAIPKVHAFDDNNFVICTEGGEIFVTDDKGKNWKRTFYDPEVIFNKMSFYKDHGYAVERWVKDIYISSDRGITWNKYNFNNPTYAYDILFVNENTGYFAGGFDMNHFVYKTTNGGETWDLMNTSFLPAGYVVHGLGSIDPNKIFFFSVFTGVYFKTGNGGASWISDTLPDSETRFSNMVFRDSLNGMMFSESNRVLKTTDGGDSWFFSRSDGTSTIQLFLWDADYKYDLSFFINSFPYYYKNADGNNLLNSGGLLFYISIDNGDSWGTSRYPFIGIPYSGSILNDSSFILSGSINALSITTDKGKSYKSLNNYQSLLSIKGIHFFSETFGFVFGTNGFIKTYDGGKSFINKNYPIRPGSLTLSSAVLDTNTFFIGTDDQYILRTTDQGETWDSVAIDTEFGDFIFEIKFPGINTGYACAEHGLFKSTDKGATWVKIFSPGVYRMDFIDSLTGWTASYGNIRKTTDGGVTWQHQGYQGVDFISFLDQSIGIAGTDYKDFKYTTDGGNSWLASAPITTKSEIAAVKIFKTGEGKVVCYAVCEDGDFYYSLDSGKVWFEDIKDKPYPGYRWYFQFSGRTLWVGSQINAYIMKRSSFDELTDAEIALAPVHHYSLSQNYPNPFNPSTVIKYDLPEDGHIELSVYDILGKKIIRLEDQYKAAGSYQINFDAAELSSGLYFYTLKTPRFTSTKKMLLVR